MLHKLLFEVCFYRKKVSCLTSLLGFITVPFPRTTSICIFILDPSYDKNIFNFLADHSLEAQDIMYKMEQFMPTLESILSEVDQFVESNKTHNDDPHIIDVIMPMLCSYLPFWWSQGPDNVSPTGG